MGWNTGNSQYNEASKIQQMQSLKSLHSLDNKFYSTP